MASTKLSALFSDIRGFWNENIFSRNHYGSYIKVYAAKPDENSPSQQRFRNLFKPITLLWKNLTEAERIEWDIFADGLIKRNIFGDSYIPTSFNTFMSCNQNIRIIGPPVIRVPNSNVYIGDIHSFKIDVSDPDPNFWFMDFSGQAVSSDCVYFMYATPGVRAGINYVQSQYRYIGYIPVSTTDTYVFFPEYNVLFPAPVSGQKLFLKIRCVNYHSGIAGPPIHNSIIIP